MVEDNQIKAQVSPFAIREGEIKTFDGKDGYVSMNQIIHKINIGHITDIHFKILEREESKNRITEILVEVYGKSPKAVEELKEGSQFVEFGMTDGCRYIGVIIDYHIIEILYLDPNHLTFVNYKFNIPSKMSYTVPSMYNLKSDKYLNSNTSNSFVPFSKRIFVSIPSPLIFILG
mgnify:CR=1 FL=1